MGVYLNPENAGFQSILNGLYIDKSELICYVNRLWDTQKD